MLECYLSAMTVDSSSIDTIKKSIASFMEKFE
jgi:hypothetical protein